MLRLSHLPIFESPVRLSWGSFVISLITSGKHRDSTLKGTTTASFHIRYNSSLTLMQSLYASVVKQKQPHVAQEAQVADPLCNVFVLRADR
jgi:hypothetical protein